MGSEAESDELAEGISAGLSIDQKRKNPPREEAGFIEGAGRAICFR